MIKHICDCCKEEIKDTELWKVTIERNDCCISALAPGGKFVYDLCATCASIIKRGIED